MGWLPAAWRGDPVRPKFAPDPEPTLETFAWERTAEVLEVEPGLVWLADAVSGRAWTELGWAQVDRIAALLLGPARRPIAYRPTSDLPPGLRSALFGETSLRRYCAALRSVAAVEDLQESGDPCGGRP